MPILPGGIPGMALLPQPPGAPPIMVPIIPPSTGAHLFNQQQQIRLAVAHAQAAAAAQQSVRVRHHIHSSLCCEYRCNKFRYSGSISYA